MLYRWFLLVGPLLAGFGCAHRTQKGDAAYVEPYGPQLGLCVSALTFPKVPLGRIGTTTITVRELDGVAYPEDLRIRIPRRESRADLKNQPWRSTKFTVSILHPKTAEIIYSQHYDLAGYPAGKPWTVQGEIFLLFGRLLDDYRHESAAWPKLSAYDIRVDVTSPSRRLGDTLEIGYAV